MNHRRTTFINCRTLAALAAVAVAVGIAAGQLFLGAGGASAHQPDGLRMSPSEMSAEPPCPYGHDDGCAAAPSASPGLIPGIADPEGGAPAGIYRSSDPHEFLPDAENRHNPDDLAELFASVDERARQIAIDTDAGAGLPQPDAAVLRNDGGDDQGSRANLAITTGMWNLPWVRDGQTPSERLTLAWLSELQNHNPGLASALTRMPFLRDHTPGDRQAIQSLTVISRRSTTDASAIVNAAAFADGGGVDNNEAKIIAVIGLPYGSRQYSVVNQILRSATLEQRRVTGQYGNAVHFAIVRTTAAQSNSNLMQTAISATRHAEILMAQALPTDFVGILVADRPGALGASNNISIQVNAGFDGTYYSDRARQSTVAHEIGHYWWSGNFDHENWISEGAAQYIGAYSVWRQFGDIDVYTEYWPCPYYRTIEHLRADNPQYGSNGSACNYSLGERLFIDLDRSMTAGAFNAAFRDLHRRLSTYRQDEIDQGVSLVRAFCPTCATSFRNLGNTGHTLARRYGEKVFNDTPANGYIPGLGAAPSVSLHGYSSHNRQYGVPQVPAASPDQRRWVRVWFSGVANPPETVTIIVRQYHESRYHDMSWRQQRPVYSSGGNAWFYAYLGSPTRRAPGHHWVYIYNTGGQKVAGLEYQVIP